MNAWEISDGWSLQKKRSLKKRKAVSSPEYLAELDKVDKPERRKITQNEEQGITISPSTSAGKVADKKRVKFPPFNLINVKEYNIIVEIINILSKEPAPIITKGAEGKYKINVYSEVDFRTLSNILEVKGIEWFNYENKSVRPNKVMMRGLGGSIDTEDIKLALTEMRFNIIDVSNIHIKKINPRNIGEKIKIKAPLHRLTFSRDEDLKKIFDIKNVLYTRVKIEELLTNPEIVKQCKKCQFWPY